MKTISTKQQVLDEAGYTYSFDREIYFNRKTKKVFSANFVHDHSEDELVDSIREDSDERRWRFYFNGEPSTSIRSQLKRLLG